LEKLVDNAIKFTPEGKVSFGYQNMGQGKLRFFVEDSGIGIEASKLTAVFQPFYQVDLSEEREYGGNGLGLTIASRIVEQMGSVLLVESKPGLGSLFYFELALQTSSEASSATADLAVQEGAAYRILVAEDDEVNFMLLQDALMHRVEGYKFDVLQARNGLEAVEKVKESADLSLVLMDIKMPLMDGIEATRRIRELRPDLPIVAQSAYALTTERDAALAAGCDRYLFKPLDLTELLRVVRELLRLPVR
jgi:CheY-like chemotaxis protein